MLRLPHTSVRHEDFKTGEGICQNLDCLAPLESPWSFVTFHLPAGNLDTLLCCGCAPEKEAGELDIILVEVPPVLELP